jgi:hypothetical protein
MTERARGDDPAGARRVHVHRRLPGDLSDRVARLEHRLRVGVEVEMALRSVGVAPRDREHLLLLAEQPFHEAPPGRDVEDVVLVDPRRNEQQRHLVHPLGRRPVLDQLEYVGPQHHRAGRYRKISAHLELRHIDAGGEMRRARDIAQETPPASHQVGAADVDTLLQHRRFDQGKFVGASASSTLPAANRAWRSVRQSTPASEIRRSTVSHVAR